MKYRKNKKFNISKFLFIIIGLCSCVGALYIQKTLSYFYTSYGFANTFQTPEISGPTGSVTVYQKCTLPELWNGDKFTDEVHIANSSNEGEDSRYVRVAHPKIFDSPQIAKYVQFIGFYDLVIADVCNSTDGIRNLSSNGYVLNEEKWVQNGPWFYYKTPLAPQVDIQIYDAVYEDTFRFSGNDSYGFIENNFLVETLPTTVTDEEFEEAWGVSKSELGLS